MKKFLTSLFVTFMALSPMLGAVTFPTIAQAATTNQLIRGSNQTVYWYASNGKRYVFPSVRVYQSWYSDFSGVQTVGDTELYTIPIGGNVTYRPGWHLIKITTDPKVYAVSRYGILRWVTSEGLATQLYGQNWARLVDDIPDEFFVNYTVGSPINSTADYSPNNEYAAVTSPNDNISAQSSVPSSAPTPTQTPPVPTPVPTPTPNPTGTTPTSATTGYGIYLGSNVTSMTTGQTISLTAIVTDPTGNYYNWIDIYRDGTRERVGYCQSTRICTVPYTLNFLAGETSVRFEAVLRPGPNGYGNQLANGFSSYITLMSGTSITNPPMIPTIISPTANQVLNNYPRIATITWNGSVKRHRVQIECDTCVSVTNLYSGNPYSYTTDGRQNSIVTEPLAGDNWFRVHVQAVNDDGSYGVWSDYVYFRYLTPSSTPTMGTVTAVSSALNPNYQNRCNQGFGLTGTITTNGATSVMYQWQRSDGAITPIETLGFNEAGSKTVSTSWFLSSKSYYGWMGLRIISPNDLVSNQTIINSNCEVTPTTATNPR
ncbi:hypothetical protein EXS71_00975 [Candidatus Uhrbacteria bacterium]|nr:hypothetical protein [Candidatus Uhrbacteria bacterium]